MPYAFVNTESGPHHGDHRAGRIGSIVHAHQLIDLPAAVRATGSTRSTANA